MHSVRIPIFVISVIVVFCAAVEIPKIQDEPVLWDRITKLENVIKSLSTDTLAYEKTLNGLQGEIKQVKDNSEKKLHDLKKELDFTNGMLSKAMDIIAKLESASNGSTRHHPFVGVSSPGNMHKKDRRLLLPVGETTTASNINSVAFSVGLVNHQEHLGVHQIVRFDHVITNVGAGFDPVTSIFKAPVSGVYFFTVVIMSHAGEDIETQIVKNGVALVNTYSGDSTTWNEGSQSTVIHLNVGDDVYIHIQDNIGVNDGNVRVFGGLWSSFSGFLISQ